MGPEHPSIVPYGNVFDDKDSEHLVLAVGLDSQPTLFATSLAAPSLWLTSAPTWRGAWPDRKCCKWSPSGSERGRGRSSCKSCPSAMCVLQCAIADMATVFEASHAHAMVMREGASDGDSSSWHETGCMAGLQCGVLPRHACRPSMRNILSKSLTQS